MKREVAESLMKRLLELGEFLDAVDREIDGIEDLEERRLFRRSLGELTGALRGDLIRPLARQYPDLDPFKKSA
jgi:hypothetical protein